MSRDQTKPITVMFVDDDPGLCGLAEMLLSRETDIELVGTADNGAGAIKMAAELCPDVLITDFRLPDISGVEVSNLVAEACPETRLVLISGYSRDEIKHELTMPLLVYVDKRLAFSDFPGMIRKLAR